MILNFLNEDEVSRRNEEKHERKRKIRKKQENHVIKICQTNVESVCSAKSSCNIKRFQTKFRGMSEARAVQKLKSQLDKILDKTAQKSVQIL